MFKATEYFRKGWETKWSTSKTRAVSCCITRKAAIQFSPPCCKQRCKNWGRINPKHRRKTLRHENKLPQGNTELTSELEYFCHSPLNPLNASVFLVAFPVMLRTKRGLQKSVWSCWSPSRFLFWPCIQHHLCYSCEVRFFTPMIAWLCCNSLWYRAELVVKNDWLFAIGSSVVEASVSLSNISLLFPF